MQLNEVSIISLFTEEEYTELQSRGAYDLLWPVYLYTVNYKALEDLSLFEYTVLKFINLGNVSEKSIAKKLCLHEEIVHSVIEQLRNNEYIEQDKLEISKEGKSLLFHHSKRVNNDQYDDDIDEDSPLKKDEDSSLKKKDIFFKPNSNQNSNSSFIVMTDAIDGELFPQLFSYQLSSIKKSKFNKSKKAKIELLYKKEGKGNNSSQQQADDIILSENNFIYPKASTLGFRGFLQNSDWQINHKIPSRKELYKLINDKNKSGSNVLFPIYLNVALPGKIVFLHTVILAQQLDTKNYFALKAPFFENNQLTSLFDKYFGDKTVLLKEIFNQINANNSDPYKGSFEQFVLEGKLKENEHKKEKEKQLGLEDSSFKDKYYEYSYVRVPMDLAQYVQTLDLSIQQLNSSAHKHCFVALSELKTQISKLYPEVNKLKNLVAASNELYHTLEEQLFKLNKLSSFVFKSFVKQECDQDFIKTIEDQLKNPNTAKDKVKSIAKDLKLAFSYGTESLVIPKFKLFNDVDGEDCNLLFLYFILAFEQYKQKSTDSFDLNTIEQGLYDLKLYNSGLFSLFINYKQVRNKLRHDSKDEVNIMYKIICSVIYFMSKISILVDELNVNLTAQSSVSNQDLQSLAQQALSSNANGEDNTQYNVQLSHIYNRVQEVLTDRCNAILSIPNKKAYIYKLIEDSDPQMLRDKLVERLVNMNYGGFVNQADFNALDMIKKINPQFIREFLQSLSSKDRVVKSLNVAVFGFLFLEEDQSLIALKEKYPSFLIFIQDIIIKRGHGNNDKITQEDINDLNQKTETFIQCLEQLKKAI